MFGKKRRLGAPAPSIKRSGKRVTRAKIYRKGKKANARAVVNLNKKVNRLIRGIETKELRVEATTDLVGTGNASFKNQVFCIGPSTTVTDPKCIVIPAGDGEGNRDGNQITTKANFFKFVAILKPWNSSTNANPRPMYLKVWVVSVRGGAFATSWEDVSNLITTRFFDTGNSYAGFSDTVLDTLRPINEDVFRVNYVKTFKIGPSQTMASGAGGATPTSAQGYTNNDFKLSVKWTVPLTKFTQKNVRYNDTDNYSFNNNKWLFFTMHNADGSTVGLQTPLQLYYNHTYRYTDM